MPSIDASKTLKNSHGGKSHFRIRAIFHHPQWKRKDAEEYAKHLRGTDDYVDETKVEEFVVGGFAGPSIIERCQTQMDKRRKKMEETFVEFGPDSKQYLLNKGRYEGIAGTLAIMRSSSLQHEITCSNERLGIE